MMFGHLARRIIVEANVGEYDVTPEYVVENWLKPRYKTVLTHAAFGSINKQSGFAFNTVGELSTGTVAVTNGDATVTASSAIFTALHVGSYVTLSSTGVNYRIASVTDSTHLELDAPYIGTTDAAATYRLAKRFYNISNELRWIVDILLGGRHGLIQVSSEKLDELAPRRVWTSSIPQYWAPAGWDQQTGERIVEIYPPSDQPYRLDVTGYLNIVEPTLGTSPVSDIDDRLLVEGCLSDALKFRASKEPIESIETMRALLDLARSHERDYQSLLLSLDERESKDAPPRRMNLRWRGHQEREFFDVITAEQEIYYNRPPY